ncbi:NAD(P)-dependent dehydrogenase (short-subunit alcohol dehydrogenase family) [Nocardiopsis mwathae]|uniref:NAD(P)-dependent dehydrogenase (Short-subunit alcohol dehydrogenase family) n=1 Tax=Nocardiopsis mwathae TaxID=1472723 RepID=A0A7X0D7E5_9ACTN|nr:styrene monooxygenase/indole monooxygenase family protein [Nocardiopsis mwathae]MBB6172939.1 NAD(P)-dependent dehydrogenase (short-subunit alcohol dehydrogenase family) [Nocardiopsis mwathae]
MRRILVCGAGQSGLQLALGLLDDGYDVTVVSARTSDEIRAGYVTSTQCMFGRALAIEREQRLNLWDSSAPAIEGLGVSVGAVGFGGRAIDWLGHLDVPAQSVDQRVKMAGWLEEFESRGGKVVVHGATVGDLEGYAHLYDLVIVAAGKGEIVHLFDRDDARSRHTAPQRSLSVVYVHGMAPRPEHPGVQAVRCNLIPGVGELFVMPALTHTGPCDILFFEGIPGGPLDVFGDIRTPDEHLWRTLELMRLFTPWEYGRCRNVELTDPRAVLTGGYTPVVRGPVGRLPNGRAVLGMADVVVANDPITGQGSNSASKCAALYRQAIREHGDRPFDAEFMARTFERYWSYARPVTEWTDAMLAPPAPHMLRLIEAAERHRGIADRFANGFDDPTDLESWFLDPVGAARYLAYITMYED